MLSRTSGRCHQPFTADEKTEEEYLCVQEQQAGKNGPRTERYTMPNQVISHGYACINGVAHIQQQKYCSKYFSTTAKLITKSLFQQLGNLIPQTELRPAQARRGGKRERGKKLFFRMVVYGNFSAEKGGKERGKSALEARKGRKSW